MKSDKVQKVHKFILERSWLWLCDVNAQKIQGRGPEFGILLGLDATVLTLPQGRPFKNCSIHICAGSSSVAAKARTWDSDVEVGGSCWRPVALREIHGTNGTNTKQILAAVLVPVISAATAGATAVLVVMLWGEVLQSMFYGHHQGTPWVMSDPDVSTSRKSLYTLRCYGLGCRAIMRLLHLTQSSILVSGTA